MRKPQVRYFESRKAFYCQFQGKQHKLAVGPDDSPSGPTYLAALDAFRQVVQMGSVQHAKDRNTVRAVLETYLQHKQGKLKGSTLERRLYSFRPFCAAYGETAVGDLTHFMVEDFIARRREPRKAARKHAGQTRDRTYAWGDAAVTAFMENLAAAFNWAVKSSLISANPVADMERPAARSRSRDCVLTPDQHRLVLAACRTRSLRNMVTALEHTGARPSELVAATAADWGDALGAIVYYGDDRRRQDEFRHKTAGKKKDRVINFTGEALAMMRSLVREHPTGALFRTVRGQGYADKSVVQCFRALRERIGIPKLTPYSYRHTFATRWLLAGRSIEVLAELLGNSPNTIRKHYAHLCSDRLAIRRHLEEFRTEEGTETARQLAPPAASAFGI